MPVVDVLPFFHQIPSGSLKNRRCPCVSNANRPEVPLLIAAGEDNSRFFCKNAVEGWDVSLESPAKLESQFRRVPDCELLFLAKVLGVEVMDLFPAKLDLKKLDPTLR